jgi:hypothetical protein
VGRRGRPGSRRRRRGQLAPLGRLRAAVVVAVYVQLAVQVGSGHWLRSRTATVAASTTGCTASAASSSAAAATQQAGTRTGAHQAAPPALHTLHPCGPAQPPPPPPAASGCGSGGQVELSAPSQAFQFSSTCLPRTCSPLRPTAATGPAPPHASSAGPSINMGSRAAASRAASRSWRRRRPPGAAAGRGSASWRASCPGCRPSTRPCGRAAQQAVPAGRPAVGGQLARRAPARRRQDGLSSKGAGTDGAAPPPARAPTAPPATCAPGSCRPPGSGSGASGRAS